MNDQIPEIDVHTARERAADGALLVDVREPHEWADGHAEGALHLPLGDLDPAQVPTDRQLVMVCRSGNRSGKATQALLAAGRTDVVNMAGGMLAWQRAGLPQVLPQVEDDSS